MTNFDSSAAVVIHWGDANLTQKAVRSLIEKCKFKPEQIFVVENGMASLVSPSVANIVKIGINKGYAAGVNRGINEAIKNGFENFFVMNNDLECPAGVVAPMLEKLKNNKTKIGCLGAVVNEGDGRPVYGGGKINWFRGRVKLSLFPDKKLDYISGAFFLISKECFSDVGPMPEEFFHTWEDVAYSFLIKKKGWKIGWVNTPVIEHPRSRSMGDSELKTYYLVRNGALFARKYAPKFRGRWLVFVEPFREELAKIRGKWEVVRALKDAQKWKR